ncbi:MAG: sulfatase-like hydrolase/transferase [Epsilonproteobacteria bacterium]|nr:sulfatase-like hydrolase/transferase [Campylobacterota bacterium]
MKILGNFIFAVLFTLFLLLPDFIANFWWKNYYIFTSKNTIKEIIITFVIAFIISFLPKKQKIFWGLFFIALSFVQIGYYGYFRTYMPPYQLDLLFSEYKDIIDSLKSIVFLVIFLIFALIGILFILNFFHHKTKPKTHKYTSLILITLLIIFPFIMAKKKAVYMPNATHFSYLNTLFAIDLWIIDNLSPQKTHKFKPYTVKKINGGRPIVIMIMGESLNFKRMHLYGWDVNDTPNFDKLAKTDKNFEFAKAISGGINTPVSVVTFFNVKREPQNIGLLLSQKTNLLKLAKQNGYKTYWLSMQEEGTSISSLLNYADIKKTRKDFKEKYDDALIKELKKIPFNNKTFIVLHLRADHSPYEEYTPKSFYKWPFNYENYHKYKIYSYYDSVLYVDYIISSIINYMKAHHKNFIIYFTSDHAEMLGFPDEHGKYGHSQLVFGDTYVPFIYYSDAFHKKLSKKYYNHYLISKMLAKDLGYEITNPNDNGTYFVNGVKIDGSAGFLHYKFKNQKIIKLKDKD